MARFRASIIHACAALLALAAPSTLFAQYSETKMGEYLHYAMAAGSGGVCAGYDSINYASPSLYTPANGWVDLPYSLGLDASSPYYGYATGISHDGTVVSGYTWGTSNGTGVQYAAYWINGVESLVPAPPDNPGATLMMATGVSGDGTTLLVQDVAGAKTETYVFEIGAQSFTSLGFLGTATQQTIANAISKDGSVVAGYSTLDNGNIDGFRWTSAGGMQDLGIPATDPNTVYLEPTCISDDGSTVFGRLTELNGWVGFRYTTAAGFQDLGDLVPYSCTADGKETVGIENMYFPALWNVTNGAGYLDHLINGYVTPQPLGTTRGPVTITPDGSLITAIGPDVYLTDQTWYGTWQVKAPVPFRSAPIAPKLLTYSTAYMTAVNAPPGTLIQYAEFNTGAVALIYSPPSHASVFVLNADGSFSYTPAKGFGDSTDSFRYRLLGPHGHSNVGTVQISVASHISRLLPPYVTAGSPDTLVTVIGAGFVRGDWIAVGGTTFLPATFLSSTQLQVTIPASLLVAKASLRITVEGTSNIATLYVR